MQMRLSSSAASVRAPCRPRRACNAVVRRVQVAVRRDVRAAFFKLGGKSGEAEAYGQATVRMGHPRIGLEPRGAAGAARTPHRGGECAAGTAARCCTAAPLAPGCVLTPRRPRHPSPPAVPQRLRRR